MKYNRRPLINEALRLLRLYIGLSQSEIADKLNVSQSLISDVERGSKAVSMELMQKYSEEFKIKMSQLMFFAEELENDPPRQKGKLIIANKVLQILEKLAPKEA